MNERGKEVDTTFLSLDQAEERGFIHRDYIAHCFRWSHVVKHLMKKQRYKTARILDIGCGREVPLAKMLHSNKTIPEKYVGIDAGPILPEAAVAATKGKLSTVVSLHANTEWGTKFAHGTWAIHPHFSDITCFEVAEHVEPPMLLDMLDAMIDVLEPFAGRIWLSTPCWNYKDCAANHVNEMTYGAFGAVLMESGLFIENVHGTFASIYDYLPHMSKEYLEVFNDLRDYYDSNVLSTIFAPMFPAHSRNCLWECRLPTQKESPNWDALAEQQKPWGSSHRWEEMARQDWQDNWYK